MHARNLIGKVVHGPEEKRLRAGVATATAKGPTDVVVEPDLPAAAIGSLQCVRAAPGMDVHAFKPMGWNDGRHAGVPTYQG